mmetsp:Transcript_20516/g.29759  ORF Transcript_20516/g.29759 Transcript_20516/m.29759 type:complete len:256 (-) Transcript_20516:201-968(-)
MPLSIVYVLRMKSNTLKLFLLISLMAVMRMKYMVEDIMEEGEIASYREDVVRLVAGQPLEVIVVMVVLQDPLVHLLVALSTDDLLVAISTAPPPLAVFVAASTNQVEGPLCQGKRVLVGKRAALLFLLEETLNPTAIPLGKKVPPLCASTAMGYFLLRHLANSTLKSQKSSRLNLRLWTLANRCFPATCQNAAHISRSMLVLIMKMFATVAFMIAMAIHAQQPVAERDWTSQRILLCTKAKNMYITGSSMSRILF